MNKQTTVTEEFIMQFLYLAFINIGFRALTLKQNRDQVHEQHETNYILHYSIHWHLETKWLKYNISAYKSYCFFNSVPYIFLPYVPFFVSNKNIDFSLIYKVRKDEIFQLLTVERLLPPKKLVSSHTQKKLKLCGNWYELVIILQYIYTYYIIMLYP